MLKFGDAPATYKKWVWKDETNTLEQINTGLQPLSEKQQLNFTKMKKDYNISGKGLNHTYQAKTRKSLAHVNTKPGSPIPSIKANSTPEEHLITLDDVKNVTFKLMSDSNEFSENFQLCLRRNQFDELLAVMLLYFEAFFVKVNLEAKYDLSTAEKRTYSDITHGMEVSQKILSKAYCILILGLDTEKQQHMACGKSRKSNTKGDREFYENLYAYSSFMVWITFGRKQDFQLIQKEVGRLFRSHAFNPHGRPFVDNEFKSAYELKQMDFEDINLTPTATSQKRPPIKSILDQRSPVLVSLFPTSKECSPWLLDRRMALMVHENKSQANEQPIVLNVDQSKLKVGIIGEKISGFNLNNLTPFGTESESEKDDDNTSLSDL